MTALYVTDEHAYVRKVGSTLAVRKADGSVVRLPLEQVDQVVCIGDVSWSGAALRELSELGIGVAYIGPRGEWVGRWEPREAKTVLLRRLQFAASEDTVRSLGLARGFVVGKIRNCRSLLQRARRAGMLLDEGEEGLLAEFVLKAERAESLDELRGIEGEAASVYFRAYGRLVSVHGFEFGKRVRRPPSNPVNAMLSFGYALLTSTCASAVRAVGFDAHVGFLHRDRYGRESLALDVCEEFRPVIVDALVSAMIHRRVLSPDDFEVTPTSATLEAQARRRFIEQYSKKLASEVRHPVLKVRMSHQRAVEVQARLIAKTLTGEVEHYVPFSKR